MCPPPNHIVLFLIIHRAVVDAKAEKQSGAKGEAKTAGPKGTADSKAGKEASAKGAEVAAKSEKVSQGKYVLFVGCEDTCV